MQELVLQSPGTPVDGEYSAKTFLSPTRAAAAAWRRVVFCEEGPGRRHPPHQFLRGW